eukprot:TRINITY_DN8563_c0_g2_i2.p1 TRINITY_DN8563_c0_g2~~TRINITY_DN8563_c0_g2_i2.p1  ORF type:complete len:277 (-),score=-19.13 TRINITY_DN8563_c0_g2_i2:171-1001(-)
MFCIFIRLVIIQQLHICFPWDNSVHKIIISLFVLFYVSQQYIFMSLKSTPYNGGKWKWVNFWVMSLQQLLPQGIWSFACKLVHRTVILSKHFLSKYSSLNYLFNKLAGFVEMTVNLSKQPKNKQQVIMLATIRSQYLCQLIIQMIVLLHNFQLSTFSQLLLFCSCVCDGRKLARSQNLKRFEQIEQIQLEIYFFLFQQQACYLYFFLKLFLSYSFQILENTKRTQLKNLPQINQLNDFLIDRQNCRDFYLGLVQYVVFIILCFVKFRQIQQLVGQL